MLRYGAAILLKSVVQTTLFKSIVTKLLFFQCIEPAASPLYSFTALQSSLVWEVSVQDALFWLYPTMHIVGLTPHHMSFVDHRRVVNMFGSILRRASIGRQNNIQKCHLNVCILLPPLRIRRSISG